MIPKGATHCISGMYYKPYEHPSGLRVMVQNGKDSDWFVSSKQPHEVFKDCYSLSNPGRKLVDESSTTWVECYEYKEVNNV